MGLGAAGLLAVLIAVAVEPAVRREVVWGIATGFLVQVPLGWWTLRSIGSERFQLAWVAGMLGRLALVAIAGLVVIPALGWQMGPALGTLVGTALALLLVEAVTALREHSGINAR
jgi:hypothetical protein